MVKKHGTLVSLMLTVESRLDNGRLGAEEAVKFLADELEEDQRRLVSGSVSPKFIDEHNPFARGDSAANNFTKNQDSVGRRVTKVKGKNGKMKTVRIPLRPINVRSGDLLASVRMSKQGTGVYDIAIGRGVPHARYILHPAGTVLMVGRGVQGWRNINPGFPMGELEKRHRARKHTIERAIKLGHLKTK